MMLQRRKAYLPGKFVVGAVGQGVLYHAFADFFPLDLEGALKSSDALLAD